MEEIYLKPFQVLAAPEVYVSNKSVAHCTTENADIKVHFST